MIAHLGRSRNCYKKMVASGNKSFSGISEMQLGCDGSIRMYAFPLHKQAEQTSKCGK
jgi:hypothetical protein